MAVCRESMPVTFLTYFDPFYYDPYIYTNKEEYNYRTSLFAFLCWQWHL